MRTLNVVCMVVLCVSYVATAKFGLSLDVVHSVAAAVWPPTGIAFLAQSLSASLNLATVLQRVVAGAKEVHHRVKNNMQIVSSLLELQSDVIDNATLLAQFRDSQDRIRSMALIHETLYQSQDLARLDLALYINTLSAQLVQSYNVDPQRITVWIQVEPPGLHPSLCGSTRASQG